ncbi:formate dehydrogenase accessory sulfurtransferase FdhD [Flexivirga sp. ID2601S]|uniref:Sulfur carrier protein FdhD n=1 Tax=Flexivirga aerilata TaxID=1656889 RepID=A0A849AM80_9MICO|nr:formate dehydrogenase accessory sulfurtransferase FdhD [Flexivirga aerilata]NNG40897.1 formate dehydrogenase accessory sulfurtransferase FdhD [Flexivirga aerilata]
MGRITSRHKVLRIDLDHGETRRVETVAVEEPLEIRVGDEVLTVTMRTPGHDIELAHGLLQAEGVITARDDVQVARYCADTEQMNVLQVLLRGAAAVPTTAQRSLISHGGCGLCGKTSIDAIAQSPAFGGGPARSDLRVPAERIAQLPDLLREGQEVFERTGGVHAAGLFGLEGPARVIREDIGRHNAVDKVTGWALLEQEPTDDKILMVSSRASFEIVQKTAMAGIGVLACVSAPSSLAIEAAEELGITLIAYTRGRRMTVCSHPDRVVVPS